MADLGIEFAGLNCSSPFMLASAPPTATGEMIKRAFEAGWSGAVTKTIALEAAIDVRPRLARLALANRTIGLENIALYLYLRKSINGERDDWKPPSIRHLRRELRISSGKIYTMLERLEKAHLLGTESGVGEAGGNVPNRYSLFAPLSGQGFVSAAEAGVFPVSIRDDSVGCT